jgi:hypothetical protein
MRRFEDWWQDSIRILDSPCKIRNWTADKGYTVEGHFFARSYRSLSEEEQSDWNEGHPFAAPNNWIVCTQVKGGKVAIASKKSFKIDMTSGELTKVRRSIGQTSELLRT